MNDIQSLIPASLTLRNTYQQVTALAAGKFHGDTVHQQPSVLSLVQSAAEELGFLVQGKIKTNFQQRLRGDSSGIDRGLLERAKEYLEKVPGIEKQQKLSRFIEQLKQNPEQAALELLSYRDKNADQDNPFSGDPALYYAALTLAKEAIQQLANPSDCLAALEEAMHDSMSQHGPTIRAGFNISETACEHASPTLGTPEKLCGFYCDTVLDYGGLTDTYNAIVKQFGEKDFQQSLQFLMRALGADFYAQGSSIEPTKLQVVINDMFSLKILGGMLEQCSELVDRMQSYYQQLSSTSGQQLMDKLLALKDQNWLRTEHVLQLTDSVALEKESHSIYFLTEIKELLRLIPEKAYQDINQREKLLHAVQDALNSVIGDYE